MGQSGFKLPTALALAASVVLVPMVSAPSSSASADEDNAAEQAIALGRIFQKVVSVVGEPADAVPWERWHCHGSPPWITCKLHPKVTIELRLTRKSRGYVEIAQFKTAPSNADMFMRALVLVYGRPDSSRDISDTEVLYSWDVPHHSVGATVGEDEVEFSDWDRWPLGEEEYITALDLLKIGRGAFKRLCVSHGGALRDDPDSLGCFMRSLEVLARIYFQDGKIVAASISRPKRYMEKAVAAIVDRYGDPHGSEVEKEQLWLTPDGFLITLMPQDTDYILGAWSPGHAGAPK